MTMKIAYLTNQYPKVSHTFIRREILALESLGMQVGRFTLRGTPDALADAADLAEQAKCRVVLDSGAWGLVSSWVRCVF
jgi:colanic acid/amylovoran biosynthesis glycosyltransferase